MSDNNQDPNSNAAFSQPGTGAQSNPFTSELKGEFTSDFGTNTNAVSQIFKGGGFSSENKSKIILLALLGVVAAVAIYMFAFSDSSSEEGAEIADETIAEEAEGDELANPDAEAIKEPEVAPVDATKTEEAAVTETVPAVDPAAPVASSGAFTIIAPPNGGSQSYDETQGVSEFSWEGPADEIVFSRSQSMSPVVKSVKLNGATKFNFENPYPGTWYWQLKNADGVSEVSSFSISAPEPRNFPVSAPTPGGSIAGEGGVVSWQAGEKIARYSVELTPAGSSFANPAFRFGTSGTSVTLSGVTPGAYDLRVGAFSEVAGRWEWQVIQNVSVQ